MDEEGGVSSCSTRCHRSAGPAISGDQRRPESADHEQHAERPKLGKGLEVQTVRIFDVDRKRPFLVPRALEGSGT
jgi:hypothetical protein